MTSPDWKEFADATAARPAEARALADRALAPRRSALPWLLVAGAVTAAALVWLTPRGEPGPTLPMDLAPGDGVVLGEIRIDSAGIGRVEGEPQDAVIEWSAGRVDVGVEPGRGLRVAVHTPEALIRVVGTRFAVDRDALGTAVSVEHGRVAVSCADGTSTTLDPGQTWVCWPVEAVELLGRAVALGRAGGSDEDVLAAVDRGLAAGPDPVVGAELLAWRALTLARMGRLDEARAEARRYVADPLAPRRGEVAAATAGVDACDLARVAAEARGTAEDRELVEACSP